MVVLGVVALIVVIGGMVVAMRLATAQESEQRPPPSEPSDFVAPVSSGEYAWRRVDETAEQFRARVAREKVEKADSPR
jgi:hypothetical protein